MSTRLFINTSFTPTTDGLPLIGAGVFPVVLVEEPPTIDDSEVTLDEPPTLDTFELDDDAPGQVHLTDSTTQIAAKFADVAPKWVELVDQTKPETIKPNPLVLQGAMVLSGAAFPLMSFIPILEGLQKGWEWLRYLFLQPNRSSNIQLSPSDWKDFKQLSKSPTVKTLLKDKIFRPVLAKNIEGKQYFFSPVLSDADRKYVVAYREVNNRLEAYFYYTSRSDVGSWKFCRSTYKSKETGGIKYEKISDIHYTQTNQLHDLFKAVFKELLEEEPLIVPDESIDKMTLAFLETSQDEQTQKANHINFFKSDTPELAPVQTYQPGYMFEDGSPDFDELNLLLQQLPKDFYPDFRRTPKKLETIHHDELGDIDFWRYEAKLGGRKIYWDYAVSNKTHEGWVRSIVYADTPPNKFGGMKEIIDSGFITSKPLEYKSQLTGITDSEDAYWRRFVPDSEHDSYNNILFIIGRMKFMQEFCRSVFFRETYPGPKGTTDVRIPQMP